jgi:hypothetical protein
MICVICGVEIDFAFNAKFVEPDLLADYMDTSEGVIKNGLNFFLLDGKIVRGIRMVALNPEAVALFHNTIRKQLNMVYGEMEYLSCLGGFFTRKTDALFEMGRKFQYGK